jgi:hypothetical protein
MASALTANKANEAINIPTGWLSNASPLTYLTKNAMPDRNSKILRTYRFNSRKIFSIRGQDA